MRQEKMSNTIQSLESEEVAEKWWDGSNIPEWIVFSNYFNLQNRKMNLGDKVN